MSLPTSLGVEVSAGALRICDDGDLSVHLQGLDSGNKIQQCQNNVWVTIQDCGALNQDVAWTNDGIPYCVVENSETNYLAWFLFIVVIGLSVALVAVSYKLKKNKR